MTDDGVVDIRGYLKSSPEGAGSGAFAVWGGDGERSRFALPVWRAIYLAGGDWGCLLYTSDAADDTSEV